MKFLTKSSLVILSLALAAVVAEATPALGDKAVYDVKLSRGPQSVTGKVTFELTNYDKSKNSWVQVATSEFNGQKQTHTENIPATDLYDDATIDTIIANCASRGGKPETVTCPAGELPSCAMPINNNQGVGTVWISKVPFGYSKWNMNRVDGVTVEALLESFVPGTAPTP